MPDAALWLQMAVDGGRGGEAGGGGDSEAEFERRRQRLARELEAGALSRKAAEDGPKSASAGYGVAVKLASEFVAGVLVGAALGWGLDWAAGTSPFGLIGLLLLGFVAGVVNVVRAAGRTGSG